MSKKLITREEYLKALNIVEAYHNQIGLSLKENPQNPLSKVETGDHIECINIFSNQTNCLTIGKIYKVINAWDDDTPYANRLFQIKDDNNSLKTYRDIKNQFKIVASANYEQVAVAIKQKPQKSIFEVNKGDYIEVTSILESQKNNLTVGKVYKVINAWIPRWSSPYHKTKIFEILDDNKIKRMYRINVTRFSTHRFKVV